MLTAGPPPALSVSKFQAKVNGPTPPEAEPEKFTFPRARIVVSDAGWSMEADNGVTTVIVADTVNFTGNTTTDNLDGSAVTGNPFLIVVNLVE